MQRFAQDRQPACRSQDQNGLMQVFQSGDEAAVRHRLNTFIQEMEDLRAGYGVTGDRSGAASTLGRSGGVVITTDDQHVVLALSGSAWVTGNEGTRRHVGPGEGVFFAAGEPWTIEVDDEPLRYFGADGPLLRLDHFAVS
jgi:hypothetical protein